MHPALAIRPARHESNNAMSNVGVFAMDSDLDKGELLISVPVSLLMTASSSDGSVVFSLARQIVQKRHEPYSASLPWFPPTPQHDFAIATIFKDTEFEQQTVDAFEALDWNDDALVSLNEWKLACLLVKARIHRFALNGRNGQKEVKGLCPVIDLLNYSSNYNTVCETRENQIQCSLIRSITAGEEVTVNYVTVGDEPVSEVWGFLASDW